MSYLPISVKEAILKINKDWFLPAVQRPYVWGSRYESERYICKLFDSILKGYPIGGLIVWETDQEIPYRRFIGDYCPDNFPELVDKGQHGKSGKGLIYDGQQRLQTLYSCLQFTFNDKILIYDLISNDTDDNDRDKTGFSFVEKNSEIGWNFVRMNEIFSKNTGEKFQFRRKIIQKTESISALQAEIIEQKIDLLWSIFVDTDKKSLSFYPLKVQEETIVNDVFERLNTGGMSLTLADLVFTEIKKEFANFEEDLQKSSKKIYKLTHNGYSFNAYSILQLLNLIVKGTSRLDHKKVVKSDRKTFVDTWKELEEPLLSFFRDYLYNGFKINNSSIIPRSNALLPIMVYFYKLYKIGFKYKDIAPISIKKISRFLIKSQINDWNLQSYIDNFTKIIIEQADLIKGMFDFPSDLIESYVSIDKKRFLEISEKNFIDYRWFALKVLTPNREYLFDPTIKGRFNPEIDHIYPQRLKGQDENYRKMVDIIWNMQPAPGDVNIYKSNIHPKLFFTDDYKLKAGEEIFGSKYIDNYDFLFPKNNGKIDFENEVWSNPKLFIEKRRELMLNFLKEKYDIELIEDNN